VALVRSFVEKTLIHFQENRNKCLGAIALILIGYSFYNPALRFAPVDFDDLVLLSHVKNTSNPFTLFIGDWGFGNYGYRPLHSLSLWAGYQLFGVSSGPNQLLNLVLHITVIVLLYTLLLKLHKNHGLAFIFSALSLVSLYTFSPPTWISDRPTLFVGLFLMLMLNYLFSLGEDKQPNISVLAAISFLALMSKESGLVVPLTAGVFLLFRKNGFKQEKSALITIGAVGNCCITHYHGALSVLFRKHRKEFHCCIPSGL
jgi:4-amino-4-deoxy-L-arabinose transferase-like glycosyltransferase